MPRSIVTLLKNLSRHPDAQRALCNYRELAHGYDASCKRIDPLRWLLLRHLRLHSGETVIDVGCGTGPLLALLANEVGAAGRVVGVEQSPEMAALARRRVATLVPGGVIRVAQCPAERLELDPTEELADALVFCYAHDVLQSHAAIARLVSLSKPGARVAMVGLKTLPWLWGWPVNAFNLYRARRYLTTYAGLHRPWRLLEQHGAHLHEVEAALWGSAYVTEGRLGGGPATDAVSRPAADSGSWEVQSDRVETLLQPQETERTSPRGCRSFQRGIEPLVHFLQVRGQD